MGLWVQNLGVKAATLPAAIAALADEAGYWLPEPPSRGWSWASLREILSFAELDELMVAAATEAGSAALALSVHDEDNTYLSGGTADGVAFRMIFGADEFDAQELGATARELEYGGAEAFAAWAMRYAPTPIEASVARGHEDVFALLTGAGLYPEPGRQPAWMHWSPPGWASAGGWTWSEPLDVKREYAIIREPVGEFEGPPGPWLLLVARGEYLGLTAALTFATLDQVFIWDFKTADEAKRHFEPAYFGREVGEWRAVPEVVPRERATTVAWLLAEARTASAE